MSTRHHLNNAISALYEVVEVNNIGGIPSSVATEALRLVNPALAPDHAAALVAEADTRGRQQLTRDDFVHAVSMCLQNTEISDALRVTKDLVLRMRTTYRRRYLMYDAPANTPAPALLENAKLVATFRELFDFASGGADSISRAQLRLLVQDVLPDFPADASNIVKAALGEGEDDSIGFFEFMMVLQPATSRRALSDMVRMAQTKRSSGDGNAYRAASAGSAVTKAAAAASTPTSSGVGVRQPASQNVLRNELEQYRQLNAAMEQKFKAVIGSPSVNTSLFAAAGRNVSTTQVATKDHFQSVAEAEIAALKIQNEELRHQITVLESGRSLLATSPQRGSRSRSGLQGAADGSSAWDDAEKRVEELEKELRFCRAQLAIAQESTSLASAMKDISASAVARTVREHGADENTLIAKHKYLREVAASLHDEKSPTYTILTQYDLLVTTYQAMFREARSKLEAARKKPFDSVSAARQIIPSTGVVVPSAGRKSASVVPSSPLHWHDIDRPADPEMRNTRMLSDPLLTQEERNVLRAKLATQMRGAARHYQSPSTSRRRSESAMHQADEIETTVTSRDAMQKLQLLSARAHREQRLQ